MARPRSRFQTFLETIPFIGKGIAKARAAEDRAADARAAAINSTQKASFAATKAADAARGELQYADRAYKESAAIFNQARKDTIIAVNYAKENPNDAAAATRAQNATASLETAAKAVKSIHNIYSSIHTQEARDRNLDQSVQLANHAAKSAKKYYQEASAYTNKSGKLTTKEVERLEYVVARAQTHLKIAEDLSAEVSSNFTNLRTASNTLVNARVNISRAAPPEHHPTNAAATRAHMEALKAHEQCVGEEAKALADKKVDGTAPNSFNSLDKELDNYDTVRKDTINNNPPEASSDKQAEPHVPKGGGGGGGGGR